MPRSKTKDDQVAEGGETGHAQALSSDGIWDPTVKVEESYYYWKGEPRIIPRKASPDYSRPLAVDLFCGAGGLSTGLKMAGFEVTLGVDIHEPSVEAFCLNHPEACAILGDIRKINDKDIVSAVGGHSVDIVVGGVPCQGFSLSNRKRWKDDERNFLFREFVRVVELLKPRLVLLENVSGMRSTADGAFVEAIEDAVSEAGSGYTVGHRLLNAADYGVPQLRQRLIFMGTAKGFSVRWPAVTHGPTTNKPYVTVRDALGDLPSLEQDETKTEYLTEPTNDYQRLMRTGNPPLTSHASSKHPQATIDRIARTKPGESLYASFKQRVRLHPDRPAPTLISGGIRPQFSHGHPWDPRGMSIRERARIMSFPDAFQFPCGIVMGRVLTGQAVPPLLGKALGEVMIDALRVPRFRQDLDEWFQENAREFPWRGGGVTPFGVLVAEMLLRKTRAETVAPVWKELMSRWPDPEALSEAPEEEIEALLRPLGLSNIRARALRKLSIDIGWRHGGRVPRDEGMLRALPEVGPYIANATLCFGFGEPRPIVDANVHRVLTRVFGLRPSPELHKAPHLWEFAALLLPAKGQREHNFALLDFGATVCTARAPSCYSCFARSYCAALRTADAFDNGAPDE